MRTNPDGLERHDVAQIGVVESPFKDLSSHFDYASTEAVVALEPQLEEGLAGIEYFSHLWVTYRQHRSEDWLEWKGWKGAALVLPPDDDRAGQGVFSSRAPCRPALLGTCAVELRRREGRRLIVRGLDALDGTPVLDVKVYVPTFDAFPSAAVPTRWAKVMNGEDDLADASRSFHWDTSGAAFALGLRAGAALLQALRVPRNDATLSARIEGTLFFAQGFEAATGCSPLRGSLAWTERTAAEAPWRAFLGAGPESAVLELGNLSFRDAGSVLAADDADLAWTLLQRK